MDRAAKQWVSGWATLALGLGLGWFAGCGPSRPASPRVEVARDKGDSGTRAESGAQQAKAAEVLEQPATPVDFGKSFLTLVGEGKARPDVFAPEFLRVIAPPLSEDDRKAGYNEVAARAWLDRQGSATFQVTEQQEPSEAGSAWACLRGNGDGGRKNPFGLLVVNVGGKNRVAWFYRSPVSAGALIPKANAPALATGTAFCDCLFGDDDTLKVAEVLMTVPLKASVADPRPSDKELGYNPGLLRTLMRSRWRGEATGYRVTKQDAAADGKSTTLEGEFTGGSTKQPFTLTLTRDASGLWLVSAFKAG